MVIVRTTLATLVLVAIASLAYGGDQKGPCQHGCDKGKDPCPKGCGRMDCCGKEACCTTECGVTEYMGNCYRCECTTVCLPTRPCCPFKDPSCGCDKGKGCGSKGGCGHGCGECGKGKDGHEGKTCCSTKDGLLCKLGACHGSKGCGKGCDDGKCKDPCDPKDGKNKGCDDCGKGGLFGGLIGSCCSCKPRVKKHLYVKQVVVCEDPGLKCRPLDKGCGGEKVDKGIDKVDGAPVEAAPDIPEPPPVTPVKIGTLGAPIVRPVSYTSSVSLGSMFK